MRMKRFQRYRLLSGLEKKNGEMQVSTLVYVMGAEAEEILNSFHLSEEDTKLYKVVVKLLDSYFIPRRNVIYEWAKFNLRSQLTDELVDAFITDLHTLAEHCEYQTLRDELEHDRLVVGIQDKKLSESLQLDANLTLESAIMKARQSEAVGKQQVVVQRSMKETTVEDNIDRIHVNASQGSRGQQNHQIYQKTKMNNNGPNLQGVRECYRCGVPMTKHIGKGARRLLRDAMVVGERVTS
ncbi:hypothetical protein PR048_008333 [Dryococelus australis]|uniref:Gag protein n=1 Tax=Dryococelus australis TaxID=614101 RepID=A0ABQ9HWT7_9NEOP|nr:hypothetical protein PR048_008333 [Dryococelus australis]